MGGSSNTTTVQRADPWGPTQSYLRNAMAEAGQIHGEGGLTADPYGGPRVAGLSDPSRMAQQMMMGQAQGPNVTSAAAGTLSGMMDPSQYNARLEQVKENALGSAIPAAVSMFSGSGMTDSSTAMDHVGRAAAQAVAPLEYGAYQQAQDRAMQASAMAPSIDQAGYLPAQMVGRVGQAQDQMRQAEIDADMARHYETGSQQGRELEAYTNLLLGYGGMGGSQSATMPGASTGQRIGGSLLGGLGTYGALMSNPVTAPFGVVGGLGAGLMGLL